MAVNVVTGMTEEELEERKQTYDDRTERKSLDRPAFEDRFCLIKIPHQPPDYDGPQRYCTQIAHKTQGSRTICKVHHRPNFGGNEENLEDPRTAAITHGMNAKLENLRRDFDEKDEALYEWIVDKYTEAYDLDLEDDPATAYDLHRLAAEIVRAERGRGHIIKEGEVQEKDRYSSEGQLIVDEHGQVVTEKSQHYLSDMMNRQDKKISDLQRELLVSRRERAKQDSVDEAVDGFKTFAEVGAELINREENEYDPEEF